MPKINMLNMKGENAGEIELNPEIFDVEINEHAVYTVGGGRKPWRQKGTGRARQGSIRSPQWKGGGVVFAPKPRDYSYTTPKKIRRLALKSVLTSKVQEKELIIIDELSLDAPKTKEMVNLLSAVQADKKALLVIKNSDENIIKSAKNIPTVMTTSSSSLNVYDILKYNSLIITKEALDEIQEVFA